MGFQQNPHFGVEWAMTESRFDQADSGSRYRILVLGRQRLLACSFVRLFAPQTGPSSLLHGERRRQGRKSETDADMLRASMHKSAQSEARLKVEVGLLNELEICAVEPHIS